MCNLTEVRARAQTVLINGLTGTQFQVEKLPRPSGQYAKGFRLTAASAAPVFAHELYSGVQECSCPAWLAGGRECEHTALLIGAGLFSEPAWFGPVSGRAYDRFDDELVEIELDFAAP